MPSAKGKKSANTKQRSASLAAAARALVEPVDVTDRVDIRTLAKQMMASTGCGIDAAKRHVVNAARLKRGELVASGWGGARDGAGRPAKEERQP